MSKSLTTRFLRNLLVGLIATIIVGLPIVSVCADSGFFVLSLTECDEELDGAKDGSDLEKVELLSSVDTVDVSITACRVGRVVDETIDIRAVISVDHRERGPPLS